MRPIHARKSGYILITVLLLLSGLSMLVVSLLRVTWTAQEFSGFAADRTYARSLAYSGIELAKMQMAYIQEEEEQQGQQDQAEKQQQQQGQQDGQEEQKKLSAEQEYLLQVLQYINRWQKWDFTESDNGAEGSIYLHITPETGKIPLNAIFDRENKQLAKVAYGILPKFQQALAALGMQGDLRSAMEEIAQEPPHFDEPTQLLALHKAFSFFADRRFLRLHPDKQEPQTWRTPVLLDLLTTQTDADQVQIQPLFFSPSMCDMFGLHQLPSSAENRKAMIDAFKEQLPQQFSWQRDWDTLLAEYYGVQFAELSQVVQEVLATDIRIDRFSVVSYGDIQGTRVGIYAILERVAGEHHDTFRVHRMYWI